MRAVVYDRYGPPESMHMVDAPVPEPEQGQVRLRVRAASVNPYDWHIYRGDPRIARLSFGLRTPGTRGLGADVAGVVDAVGPSVTEFAVGDEVYGSIGAGAVADFAIAATVRLALKPRSLTFEEAAAVPMAALTAYQGLRDAPVKEGASVLVIGASGGVGHFAVQFARALGAGRVVAVCSGRNSAWVAQLGADRVIDYKRESVLDADERFDVVFDTVATTPVRTLRRVMWPDAVYAPAGAVGGSELLGPAGPMFRSVAAGWSISQRVALVRAKESGEDLASVTAMIDAGEARPVVERVYAMEEFAAALTRLEGQHVAGKLVIAVS